MEYEVKKLHALELIRLGVPMTSACINAQMTDEEIDKADDDEDFQKQIRMVKAQLEIELLASHRDARNRAVKSGNASGVQWMLEKLKPETYGNQFNADVQIKTNFDDFEKVPTKKLRKQAGKSKRVVE